jgi:hypothetical protein
MFGRVRRGPGCVLRRAAVTALTAALLVTPGIATAAATIDVDLGTHEFGHLTAPGPTVVSATTAQVGFLSPQHDTGDILGPWSIQIDQDGTVWMLDEVNDRLLAWSSGHPDAPSRTVMLEPGVLDFAVAGDTIYYSRTLGGDKLYSRTMSGTANWMAPLAMNGQLRFGPDGVLYVVSPTDGAWIPTTTGAGKPLSVDEQRRLTRPDQPLPGGKSLLVTWQAPHRLDVTLRNPAGQPIHSWRITSVTDIEGTGMVPAVTGNDPVVAFNVVKWPATETDPIKVETLVLRLTPTGSMAPIVLKQHTYGAVTTDLRVGPDGAVYLMKTDVGTGATVVRYPLSTARPPSTSSGAGGAGGGTVVEPTPSVAPSSHAPLIAGIAAADRSARWPWIAGGGLVTLLVAGGVAIFLMRRRLSAGAPEETVADAQD